MVPFMLDQIALIRQYRHVSTIAAFTNSIMLNKQYLSCLQDMGSQCLTKCENFQLSLSSRQPLPLIKWQVHPQYDQLRA